MCCVLTQVLFVCVQVGRQVKTPGCVFKVLRWLLVGSFALRLEANVVVGPGTPYEARPPGMTM